jgi:hypothetical protein
MCGCDNCAGRLRLARESQPNGGVIRKLRRQHLDRDRTIESDIASAVDDGHAAASDFTFDVILLAERGDSSVVERVAHAPRRVRGLIVTTSTLAGQVTSTPAPDATFRSLTKACIIREAAVIGATHVILRRAAPKGSLSIQGYLNCLARERSFRRFATQDDSLGHPQDDSPGRTLYFDPSTN